MELQRLWEGCFRPAGEETKEIAAKHRVKDTLKKFYNDLIQESMENLLPGGFICRSCVRVIERYNSIHQKVLSNMKEVDLSYSLSKWTLLKFLANSHYH